MDPSPTILLFGTADDLIETRRLVLEHSGFHVTVSLNMDQVEELLASRAFDLFILCHSLSSPECEGALRHAHTLRPAMKNLVLSNTRTHCATAEHDTVLAVFTSPQTLIATVRSLTGHVTPEPQLACEPPRRASRGLATEPE